MAAEKDNICNLPLVALIEIHRSDETGIKYVSFISWDDDSGIGIKKGQMDRETDFRKRLDKNRQGAAKRYDALIACFNQMRAKNGLPLVVEVI